METCKNRAKRISLAIKEAVKKGGFKVISEGGESLQIEVNDGYVITASINPYLSLVAFSAEFMELKEQRDFIIELLNELNSTTLIGGFTVNEDKIFFKAGFSYKDSLISADAILSVIKSMGFCIKDAHSIILESIKSPNTIRYFYEEYLFLDEERRCFESASKEKISKRFPKVQKALENHFPIKRKFPFTTSVSYEIGTEKIPLNICICTAIEIGYYLFSCSILYGFSEKLGQPLSSEVALFLSNILKIGTASIKYRGHLELSVQLPFYDSIISDNAIFEMTKEIESLGKNLSCLLYRLTEKEIDFDAFKEQALKIKTGI